MAQITVDKIQSFGVSLVFLSAIGLDDATRQRLFGIWAAGALSALTLAAAPSLRQLPLVWSCIPDQGFDMLSCFTCQRLNFTAS
jgi:hypothetical protein